jgi:DNA-binding MarR family transcriptional regulator
MVRNIPGGSRASRSPVQSQVASEVADLLQAVTHRLRREARAVLGPEGVTPAQVRALRTIARLRAPTRMSELADELQIARRSATSLVDELAARGFVVRGHDPVDGRVVTVEVTEAGHALLTELADRRRRTTAGMLGALSDSELRTLRDLLGRVVG